MGTRPQSPEPEAAEAALYRLLDLPRTLWEADRTPTLVVFDEFQDLLVARKDLDGLLREGAGATPAGVGTGAIGEGPEDLA